ncbi:MFS transporter [Mannheimia haemolytica]
MFWYSLSPYIYKETGEAAYLGIVFALEWGVRLISLVILPYFFENKNRIKPIYRYNLYQGVTFSILYLSFYLSDSILFLIGIGIIASIFFDVNFLYIEYIIQNISGKRNLLRLQSRVQSIEQVSLLLGPVISGLLIDLISVNQFFITIFVFYFLYIALYKNIKINSENNMNEYRERRNIINGINILYKKDGALELVILTNSLNIIFGACISIIPVIFLDQYDKTSYLGLFNFIIGLLSIFSIILFNKFMNVETYNSDRFIGRLSITFYICFFFGYISIYNTKYNSYHITTLYYNYHG